MIDEDNQKLKESVERQWKISINEVMKVDYWDLVRGKYKDTEPLKARFAAEGEPVVEDELRLKSLDYSVVWSGILQRDIVLIIKEGGLLIWAEYEE